MILAVLSHALVLALAIHASAGGRLLTENQFPHGTLFAASPEGSLLSLRGDLFELWSEDGKLVASCEVSDPRLQGMRNAAALRGNLALVSLMEPEAGTEENRKVVVVDLHRCQVVSSFALPGVVLGVRGGADGWLIVTHQVGGRDYGMLIVDDAGQVLERLDLPKELQTELATRGLPAGPPSLVPFRDRTLLVSRAKYELWFPSQKGRAARQLHLPRCLAVEGEWLSGEESARELRRRVTYASEETRRAVETFLEKGGSHRGFMAPVRSVAVYRDRLAVLLRDPKVAGGCRLDIWDLSREGLLAVAVTPGNSCPNQLVGLARDGLWIFQDGSLLKLPLELAADPLERPCEALASLRAGARAPGRAPQN